eukprot:TRINITY_DN2779_c0_g2_i13.p1 TRINITY_DN2779_c0_g2~~TRINITY_DN2779_c0_g2_i13.p1  ORF type:complete len:127 (-),score=14.62 TRINITY_DN2779_c0_g2_i13:892-1272(-)
MRRGRGRGTRCWGIRLRRRRLMSWWNDTVTVIALARSISDKTGGKVIYRQINILLLYRGRYYDPKKRPVIPLMLWKPHAPIYPRLVKNVADGLTFGETKEMRNRGLNSPALMKLSVYAVQQATVCM